MYRHPSSKPSSTLYDFFPILRRFASSNPPDDQESLLNVTEKQQVFSYGTSPSSSCPPTPGAKYILNNTHKKPLAVVVTEVTLTPAEDEVNPFDRIEIQSVPCPSLVEERGDVEEEVAKFPMSTILSLKRGYRSVQRKYIWDRFPLICALVIFVQIIAMSKLIAIFNSYYEKRPFVTMMVSNAILNAIADTMAQTVTSVRQQSLRRKKEAESTLEEGTDAVAMQIHRIDRKVPDSLAPGELVPESRELPPPFDFARLSRFMAWGIIMAPLQFSWLKVLSKTFPVKDGGALTPALKRMACDQLMFAPVGLAGFFTYMTVAEGGGREGLKRKFENVYMPALRSNYLIWPAVQLINFRVMPIQFQLPFVSTVGIFWTTYLSLTNSAAEVADD